jgi:hypothetical protein
MLVGPCVTAPWQPYLDKHRPETSSDDGEEEVVVLEDYEDSEDDNSGNVNSRMETHSQVNVDMEVSQSKTNLGPVFYQCRAARVASFSSSVIEIAPGEQFGTKRTKNYNPVGCMDQLGDDGVEKTFHGARVSKEGTTVNQGISLSFDPAVLVCITCKNEHSLLDNPQKPLIICASDQNFVPILPTDLGCIAIVRIENASLPELIDLTLEIFEGSRLPHGTLFLVGSVSHLGRVGTSIYASDWLKCKHKLIEKLGTFHLGPLPPIIRADLPADLARELFELASWFATVYGSTTVGFGDSWSVTVQWLTDSLTRTDTTSDNSRYSYTIPLPASLDRDCTTVPQSFTASTSRSAIIPGMCPRAVDEMLLVLITTLNRDFLADIIPCSAPRAPDQGQHQKETAETLVCIGSSSLQRAIPYFTNLGYTLIDMTQKGWIISQTNVGTLLDRLRAADLPSGLTVVF